MYVTSGNGVLDGAPCIYIATAIHWVFDYFSLLLRCTPAPPSDEGIWTNLRCYCGSRCACRTCERESDSVPLARFPATRAEPSFLSSLLSKYVNLKDLV